ncbi:hypothetical protein AB0O34_10045 [Sphaerisporangium sp. NPDC088356]
MSNISVCQLVALAVAWGLVALAWLLDSGRFPVIGKRYRAWIYEE